MAITQPSDFNTQINKPAAFPSDFNTQVNKPAAFPSDFNTQVNKPAAFPTNWTTVTAKPTTISGYAISDFLAYLGANTVAGGLGSYTWGRTVTAAGHGVTVAGSAISPSDLAGNLANSPAGTYRCTGNAVLDTAGISFSIFLRIA